MFGKIVGGLAAVGGLVQGCTGAFTQGAENVGEFVDPRVCEHTVDGTTGTTVLEDGTAFGINVLPDGTRSLSRTLGECG